MNKTRDNHFVAQWYQKGFMDARTDQLCCLTHRNIKLNNGETKIINSKRWHTPAQQFYKTDLYSTFFGTEINDDIEQKLFGPIDDNGSKAIRAFLTDDQSQWHDNFLNLFFYIDAQKLRTPKGLDWIKSRYPDLSQLQLMIEMQSLRSIHCTIWAEGVRELVSAENSETKFIMSDHPVTVYNYACPPDSVACNYPNDPDVSLKGTQTIFPLDKNRCIILTNLEYAKNPNKVNPLEQRTNATRVRQSLVNTIEFINHRKLSENEVIQINHVIKSRKKCSVAAGREEWLHPEDQATFTWAEIQNTLLPSKEDLYRYGGEMYAHFSNGSVHYQDAFGRTTQKNNLLNKSTNETHIGRNEFCGCGSGRKYKGCCQSKPMDLRTTWSELSIRERNLALCNCIRDVLGLDRGKTWIDVRREISSKQVSQIYHFYSVLWPRETDIYSLLPKSDGKFRGLYTGTLDVRVIGKHALPISSLFDEILIENPITNPNNVRPEFSPIKSPEKFKYQSLKDFVFMLELEPFIALGLINLIPNPAEFDFDLMSEMMEMASTRSKQDTVDRVSGRDQKLHFKLMTEDLLNSIAMMPDNEKLQILIHHFGLTEERASRAITELESQKENSALMMLQPISPGEGGQLIQSRIGPNYEMSLFLAQVTGSVLVTDSDSKWREFVNAQHRDKGIVNYPWANISNHLTLIPIDYQLLETLKKTKNHFTAFKSVVKLADRMVIENDRNLAKLASLDDQIKILIDQMAKAKVPIATSSLKILSPDGGFYDAKVQRLLVRSSCPKYDQQVRSIYGISLTSTQ